MYNTSEVIRLYNTEMCTIDYVRTCPHVLSANANIKFPSSVQFDVL